tara:strand:+ start:408 stop:1067 length:660 start_codon:yes stop_codon:yes gene_type:complete
MKNTINEIQSKLISLKTNDIESNITQIVSNPVNDINQTNNINPLPISVPNKIQEDEIKLSNIKQQMNNNYRDDRSVSDSDDSRSDDSRSDDSRSDDSRSDDSRSDDSDSESRISQSEIEKDYGKNEFEQENNNANIDEILSGKNIITDNSLSDILNVDSDLSNIDEYMNSIKQANEKKIITKDYNDMTVSELKQILVDMKLPVSGNKTKLIERIKENKK